MSVDIKSPREIEAMRVACRVAAETLVVVGDQDMRTPASDAEQYYQALQLRRVPTALVKVPGASHGGLAARPSQSAAKARRFAGFFSVASAASTC